MRFGNFAARKVAFRMINSKWGKADRAISQRIEEELGKVVAASGFRNPKWIVGSSVGVQYVAIDIRLAVVDVRTNHVDGRSQRAPESNVLLHGSAAGILNSRNGNAPLGQLGRRITQPDIDV